jgi:hypothetical protein
MARKVGPIIARATAAGSSEPAHVKMTLTHEEIAEMIGTTRETVSRLFSDFKKKQLLQTNFASKRSSTSSARRRASWTSESKVSITSLPKELENARRTDGPRERTHTGVAGYPYVVEALIVRIS